MTSTTLSPEVCRLYLALALGPRILTLRIRRPRHRLTLAGDILCPLGVRIFVFSGWNVVPEFPTHAEKSDS